MGRDFAASAPNQQWCGDSKQVPTDEGPAHLAAAVDLYSRRLVGLALSDHCPTAQLAADAISTATAVRGGDVAGAIYHTDRGPQHAAAAFAETSERLGITQSMRRPPAPWTTPQSSRSSPPCRKNSPTGAATAPVSKPAAASPPGSTAGTTPADDTARSTAPAPPTTNETTRGDTPTNRTLHDHGGIPAEHNSFTDLAELTDTIDDWTAHWNHDSRPLTWTEATDDLIARINRARTALNRATKPATDH